MNKPVYLDHAATTPLDPFVLAAMQPYLTEQYYNPSAQYLAARQVRKQLEAARVRVAHWLGARPREILFTAGGTEANNIAIHGVMQRYPDANIVVSTIEHDAVLEPASGYDRRLAPVKPNGLIDVEALAGLIDDNTVLVSVMYANNELGSIQPIKRIAELVAIKRASRRSALPLYFHTDACQAGAYLDLHTSRLGVDMMTINASKIYGPKQVGALYVKTGVELIPHIQGGGQEYNLRSGTENVAGIIGLGAALDLVQERRATEVPRLSAIQSNCFRQIAEELPEVIINGTTKKRLPNNIHVSIPGTDNERIMMELDERGFQVAVGSACSASSEEPSHVLTAIGLSDTEAQSSLRISMGRATTADDMTELISVLGEVLHRHS